MRIYSHKEKTQNKNGYILIYAPEHPRANRGRVFEHILVWEAANNKSIPDGYVIHHINEIKSDNRIENLLLMTREDHITYHNANRCMSDEAKRKIGEKQKARLKDQHNHPRYKEIPIDELVRMVANGETVKSVCQRYNICKYTYYKKVKEKDIKK